VQQAFVRGSTALRREPVRSACHCRADSTAARFSAPSGTSHPACAPTRSASKAVPIRSSRNAWRR
jgi:hypothetical protein